MKDSTNLAAGLVLYPLAYRDPMLKQYHSEVTIIEAGEIVRQGVIEVNQPSSIEAFLFIRRLLIWTRQMRSTRDFNSQRIRANHWSGSVVSC